MLRRSAREQKQLVEATGRDKAWISRQCNGQVTSEMERYGDFVEQLTRHPDTDPSYALLHPQIVAARTLAEKDETLLERLLHRALTQETLQQAPADVAEAEFYRGNATLSVLRERLVDHMAAIQRVVTIVDALTVRGIR